MLIEIWKPLIYENIINGLYEISNTGKIRYQRTKKILKDGDNGNGYRCICLFVDNYHKKKKTFKIHRLVIQTFKPIKDYKNKLVNHKDGDKSNNHITNLEYCNHSENTRHSYKLGLQQVLRGDSIGTSKITELTAINICELLEKGLSTDTISKKLNVSKSIVSNIRKRDNWTHISCNYNWDKGKRQYSEELIEQIYWLILNGYSTKFICRELDIKGKKMTNLINKLKNKNSYKNIINEIENGKRSTTIKIRKIKIRRVE